MKRDEALRDTWCYENIMTPKTSPVPSYRITEQTLGIAYNANGACTNDATFNNQYLGTVTSIRGGHEMKAGGSFFRAGRITPANRSATPPSFTGTACPARRRCRFHAHRRTS